VAVRPLFVGKISPHKRRTTWSRSVCYRRLYDPRPVRWLVRPLGSAMRRPSSPSSELGSRTRSHHRLGHRLRLEAYLAFADVLSAVGPRGLLCPDRRGHGPVASRPPTRGERHRDSGRPGIVPLDEGALSVAAAVARGDRRPQLRPNLAANAARRSSTTMGRSGANSCHCCRRAWRAPTEVVVQRTRPGRAAVASRTRSGPARHPNVERSAEERSASPARRRARRAL